MVFVNNQLKFELRIIRLILLLNVVLPNDKHNAGPQILKPCDRSQVTVPLKDLPSIMLTTGTT